MTPQEIERVKSQAKDWLRRNERKQRETEAEREARILSDKMKAIKAGWDIKEANKNRTWEWLESLFNFWLNGGMNIM